MLYTIIKNLKKLRLGVVLLVKGLVEVYLHQDKTPPTMFLLNIDKGKFDSKEGELQDLTIIHDIVIIFGNRPYSNEFNIAFAFLKKFTSLQSCQLSISPEWVRILLEEWESLTFNRNGVKGYCCVELRLSPDIIELTQQIRDLDIQINRLNSSGITFCLNVMLNVDNCYWADDILIWIKNQPVQDVIFSLSQIGLDQHGKDLNNKKFHLAGFFDKLGSQNIKFPDIKLFYEQVAEKLMLEDRYSDVGTINAAFLNELRPPGTKYIAASQKIVQGKEILFAPAKVIVQKLKSQIGSAATTENIHPAREEDPRRWQQVLITGWYGTETSGDKAILGEIIHRLQLYNPSVKITVTTIDEKVSSQTNFEMGFSNIRIIPINKAASSIVIDSIDAVIMGGGPLMESRQIINILNIFSEANKRKKARVIFGCGIGPIHTPEMRKMIAGICRMATAGFFRDDASKLYAMNLGVDPSFPVACDPAIAFIARWRSQHKRVTADSFGIDLKCLLREQTKEYYQNDGFNGQLDTFLNSVATTLSGFRNRFPESKIDLMPMHMYWKGNDDRIFNRKLMKATGDLSGVRLVREYLDINGLLERLSEGDIAIAMRYHGHLFCLALGIPFLSVDYTGSKGKVYNLVERTGLQDFSVDFFSFDAGSAITKLARILEQKEDIQHSLLNETEKLVTGLNDAYELVWGN